MKIGKFEKFTLGLLLFTIAFYFIGIVFVKSKQSELNIKSQEIEKDITSLQTDIVYYQQQIDDHTQLSYLNTVATSRGYYYNNNSCITAYVEIEE